MTHAPRSPSARTVPQDRTPDAGPVLQERTAFGWARRVYWGVLRFILRALARGLFGYRAFGREQVPAEGPVILAANHHSYLDPILIAVGLDRPLRFMAWAGLFRRRWFAALIRSLGAFPVRVDGWDGAAWRTALESLRAGSALVIFPEGGRSPTPALQPLKSGVALLALRARVPVVPVRIEGSFDAWPRHRRFPRPFRPCRVRFGPPLPPPALAPSGESSSFRRAVQPWLDRLRAELERPIDAARDASRSRAIDK